MFTTTNTMTTIAGILAMAIVILLACLPTHAQENLDYVLVLPADDIVLMPTTVSLDPDNETVDAFATEAWVMYKDLAIAAMDNGLDELAQHYMNKASRAAKK